MVISLLYYESYTLWIVQKVLKLILDGPRWRIWGQFDVLLSHTFFPTLKIIMRYIMENHDLMYQLAQVRC